MKAVLKGFCTVIGFWVELVVRRITLGSRFG